MWTTLGEEPPLVVLDTLEELDDPPGLVVTGDLQAQAAAGDPRALAAVEDPRVQGVARVTPAAQVVDGAERRQQHRR